MTNQVVPSLISGGLGATIAAVAVAVIQTWGKRSEARAHAADLITHAATEMIDRLQRDNKELREAVLLLTDVLDMSLPLIDAPPEVLDKLKEAKRAAERAV